MSEAAEDVPMASPVNEEEEKTEKTPQKETPRKGSAKSTPIKEKETPKKTAVKTPATPQADSAAGEEKKGLYDQPVVIEGKRQRQSVQRLTVATPVVESPKAEAFTGKGKGTCLGNLRYANEYISSTATKELKTLHKVLYLREGSAAHAVLFKRALREFNGWWFDKDSDDWKKRVACLQKMTTAEVKKIRSAVGVKHAASTKEEEIMHLMEFLERPEGKPFSKDAGKKGTKRKSGPSAKEPSKKKSKAAKKESESEPSDDDEKEGKEDAESGDSDSEAEKKMKKKQSSPKKAAKPKKTEKSKEKVSSEEPEDIEADDSKEDGEEEEKGSKTVDSDTSDDEPLADASKPSDATIIKTIKELLKTFDLAEVTLKQMCQTVINKFPESDLEDRKSWLKERIREAVRAEGEA